MRGFRDWNDNFYNCALIENRNKSCNGYISEFFEVGEYLSFVFERSSEKKCYVTKNNQSRTGYVLKERFEYDVICKVEL